MAEKIVWHTKIHPRHARRSMQREHAKIERRYSPSARELFHLLRPAR